MTAKNKKVPARVQQQLLLTNMGIPEATKTYEELCKDAKEAIQRSAEDWIPEFCVAIKRQHPLMAAKDIRKKVVNDWSDVWKANTMNNHWPDWMKNPKTVEASKQNWQSETKPGRKKNSQIQEFRNEQQDTTQQEQETQTPEQQEKERLKAEALKAEQKFESQVQAMIWHAIELTKLFTGYSEDEVRKFTGDSQALISATKNYRFDMAKKIDGDNIKLLWKVLQRLTVVSNATLEQLDDEMASRKSKSALTSE